MTGVRLRAARVMLLVVGLAVLTYAVLGILTDDGTSPVRQGLFLATLIVVHDGFLLPAAIGVGAVVVRYTPAWVRAPLQAGLYASAAVTLIALPSAIGAGRIADDPTVLPLNYARGLALVLGAIWLAVTAWALLRWRVAHPRRHPGEPRHRGEPRHPEKPA